MDNTGFWISCGKTQLIVIIDQNKSLYIIDSDNHNYTT